MNAPLLAAAGLQREARLIADAGVITVLSGGDEGALRARLEQAVLRRPPRAVISIGIGGALAPDLKVGEWVVAARIVEGERTWPVDVKLASELRRALPSAHAGAIAAGGVIVSSAADKSSLHERTGALAVDMESHVAARFAAERNLPFAALRVISDAADHALPPAVMVSMKKDGGLDLRAIVWSLLKNPRQLPALIRTGRDAEAAFGKLKLLGRDDLLGRLGVGDADLGQLPLDVV